MKSPTIAEPVYLASFHNDEDNTTAVVFASELRRGCLAVALRDDDSGLIVGSVHGLTNLEQATDQARRLAAGEPRI